MPPRQRPALAAVAAVLALAACPMLAGASATAATAPASTRAGVLLPPIGAEIPSSMLAVNSELEVKGTTYHVDFRGGIKQRVDVNPNDPFNSVRLRTVGFKVSAEIDGEKYSSVSFEQNDVDVDARSTLTVTQQFPRSTWSVTNCRSRRSSSPRAAASLSSWRPRPRWSSPQTSPSTRPGVTCTAWRSPSTWSTPSTRTTSRRS